MSEKALRGYVGKLLKPFGHVSQVESGVTTPGIPDTCFYDNESAKDVWIELKYACVGKKGFEIRKTQIAWARERIRHGGVVFFLLRYEERGGKNRAHALIRVDDEQTLSELSAIRNALEWALCADIEWDKSIPVQELLEELRK